MEAFKIIRLNVYLQHFDYPWTNPSPNAYEQTKSRCFFMCHVTYLTVKYHASIMSCCHIMRRSGTILILLRGHDCGYEEVLPTQ